MLLERTLELDPGTASAQEAKKALALTHPAEEAP